MLKRAFLHIASFILRSHIKKDQYALGYTNTNSDENKSTVKMKHEKKNQFLIKTQEAQVTKPVQ